MIVDIYTHIFPGRFFQELEKGPPKLGNMGKRMRSIPKLFDLDLRFKDMDEIGDYKQIISLPNPPIEDVAEGEAASNLARVANDAMADLSPSTPTVSRLRRRGQYARRRFLDPRGRARDQDGRARRADLHQYRRPSAGRAALPAVLRGDGAARPADLDSSRAHLGHDRLQGGAEVALRMWWCFGWPYETTIAMCRLVFDGLFDRHPGIKIVTHHLGGGMIPFFDGRIGPGMAVLGQRTVDEDYSKVLSSLKRPHLEYFKEFYGDTAMFGGTNGLQCGLDFFGADKVVFATDHPLATIPVHIKALDGMNLDAATRNKIMLSNAERLLKMKLG
jgi:uncharacterized protein